MKEGQGHIISALLLSVALAFSQAAFSQEKKAEKKKSAAKKKAAPSQDWNRFNTGAKRDLEKIEKKDAKGQK